MKIGEIRNYVKKMYHTNEKYPILVLGESGIGKTTAVREAAMELASELRKEFIQYDDSVSDQILKNPEKYFVLTQFVMSEAEPSDFLGFPRDCGDVIKYKPLQWIRVMSKCAGMLLIDEFTNETRSDLQSACYKLIESKTAGFTKLNDEAIIVCTGNAPEHSSIATQLPAPLVSRCVIISADPSNMDEWALWMNARYGDAWDKRLYAFCKSFESTNPNIISTPQIQATLEAYPCRRSETKLALLMHQGFNDLDTFCGTIGKTSGNLLDAFLRLRVDVDKLIEQPEQFGYLNMDAKILASVLLAEKFNATKDIEKLFPLIETIAYSSLECLIAFKTLIRDMPKRTRMMKYLISKPELKERLISVTWDYKCNV